MRLKTAHNRGFTLVELLVVITIMLIMAGAMMPSFSSYLKSQTLKQTQEKLKSDIRSIQNKALTGALNDKTVDVSGVARQVTHWGVRFNNDSQTYNYFIAFATTSAQFTSECSNFNNAQGVGTSVRNQGSGTLPSDMVFKGSTGCIFFDFKNGLIRPTLAGFTSPIYFGYSDSNVAGNCRNLKFNWSGGLFNSNNANCSCSDYTTANHYTNCP